MLLIVMRLLLVVCINTLCLHSMQVLCESNGVVDRQDVFIVDLPTIVPFYFTWSIWTGPDVAEWCSTSNVINVVQMVELH